MKTTVKEDGGRVRWRQTIGRGDPWREPPERKEEVVRVSAATPDVIMDVMQSQAQDDRRYNSVV